MKIVLFRTLIKLLFCIAIIASQPGCVTTGSNKSFAGPGKVNKWASLPWSRAFIYETDNYAVRTNTTIEVAEYIGSLMENAHSGYIEVMGEGEANVSSFNVNAYASLKEYEDIAKKQGFPSNVTTGLYSPEPPAAIYLPYIINQKVHPSATLVHEGTHQYIDQVMSFRPGGPDKDNLPPARHKLLSVPLWLNEGLATFMESSVVNESEIKVGRINEEKLKYLKILVRKKSCPSLESVLSKKYGQAFSKDDYAVSWGVVYVLAQENPDLLKRFMASSRQAFYDDPEEEFSEEFLSGGVLTKDFNRRWYTRVSDESMKYFKDNVVGPDSTIDEWEWDWKNKIKNL